MNKTKIILILLLAVGFFLRVLSIGTNPPSIYWDEASIGYEAYSLMTTGHDMHGSGWLQAIYPSYGDYKAPVYILLTSLAERVFGPTTLAIRLPSAIFGTMTIPILFLLALKLTSDRSVALLSAGALTFLPVSIQFSRTGFEANIAVFLIAVCLFFALLSTDRFNPLNLFLSALFGTLATYTYFSARVVVPLMIAWTFLFWGKSFKLKFINLSLWLALFGAGLFPLILSPYAKAADQIRLSAANIMQNESGILDSNALSQTDNFSLAGRILHHRYLYLLKDFIGNLFSHFQADYLFFTGDKNPRHSTGFTGLMLPLMLPIFILGISAFTKRRRLGGFVLVLWLIFLIPASVPREVPHALRSLNAVLPISLILGLGSAYALTWIKSRSFRQIIGAIYFGLLTTNFLVYLNFYHRQYPLNANLAWQDGYPQLAQYVKGQYDKYDYLVVTPGDRLFLYILFFGTYPPADLQAERRLKPLDYSISAFGKITFRPIVWSDDIRGPSRSLLIGLPGDFPPEVPIKDTIKDLGGRVQFVSVDLGVI